MAALQGWMIGAALVGASLLLLGIAQGFRGNMQGLLFFGGFGLAPILLLAIAMGLDYHKQVRRELDGVS